MDSYNHVYNGARTYGDCLECKMFKTILCVKRNSQMHKLTCYYREQTEKTHLLDVQANDLKEIDLAVLESNAIEETKSEIDPLAAEK